MPCSATFVHLSLILEFNFFLMTQVTKTCDKIHASKVPKITLLPTI